MRKYCRRKNDAQSKRGADARWGVRASGSNFRTELGITSRYSDNHRSYQNGDASDFEARRTERLVNSKRCAIIWPLQQKIDHPCISALARPREMRLATRHTVTTRHNIYANDSGGAYRREIDRSKIRNRATVVLSLRRLSGDLNIAGGYRKDPASAAMEAESQQCYAHRAERRSKPYFARQHCEDTR